MSQELAAQRKAKLASVSPRDLVSRAYFVAVAPPNGNLAEPPARAESFKMDGPVTFFLNLYSSGRTLQAKFKWYDPSGKLVSQQDRTLHGPTSDASRFWLTQVLPSVHVQAAGRRAMDLYLDDDHLGRYEFTVTQGS
jgi:hypothetical protein